MLVTTITEFKEAPRDGLHTIIIGSGAVGLYTAVELVKRGHRVTIIESGKTTLDGFPPNSYISVGAKHEGITISRSRTLGGTTNLWGGQLVEFQPVDFQERNRIPGPPWPISYEEIAPYYGPTYENLGIESSAQDDNAVWRAISAPPPELDEGAEIFLSRWLQTPNFATYYSKEVLTNRNLTVLLDHTAIGFEGNGEQITAVRVKDTHGNVGRIAGRVFIIAAGTIETSRLLLCSATDQHWRCPWGQNRNVGAYFQDHLVGRAAVVETHKPKLFFDTFCSIILNRHKYAPKIRLKNSVLSRASLLNIHGWFAFEGSVAENLIYLKQFVKSAIYRRKISSLGDLYRNLVACRKYLAPLAWRYIVDHRIFVPTGSKISFFIQSEQVPLRESQIRIDTSTVDGLGIPRVVLDWKICGSELSDIREFVHRTDQALRKIGIAELQIMEGLERNDPHFLSSLTDQGHQSGGAIMGYSEADGVVDRDLRVFGTKNLYIGGSSTFRTVSNANTTFMALTFATRLVEHLTKKQR